MADRQEMLQDLLESIKEITEDAKPMIFGAGSCIIERDKMLYLINQAIDCMPADLRTAREIVNNSNRIIEEAKATADTIIKAADAEAQKILRQEDIVINAEKEAKEIILNAHTKSGELKKLASDFCDDSLKRAEEGVAVVLEELKATRRKFKGTKQ